MAALTIGQIATWPRGPLRRRRFLPAQLSLVFGSVCVSMRSPAAPDAPTAASPRLTVVAIAYIIRHDTPRRGRLYFHILGAAGAFRPTRADHCKPAAITSR